MKSNGKNDSGTAHAADMQLVCFRLFEEEFSVNITMVREIVRLPDITRIPRTPPFVLGIANLRGNVLPIIDCRLRFSLPAAAATERTRVLVLDIEGAVTGLVVDAVNEVLQVPDSALEAPPAVTSGGVAGEYLGGVLKLENGKRLVLMIMPAEVANIGSSTGPEQARRSQAPKKGAVVTAEKAKTSLVAERQLVSFAIAGEEYAFDIGKVKEILRKSEITAIPNAAPEVKGVLTVRDTLLPILDLRLILGLEELEQPDQRILVVELGAMTVGLLIDKVNEVLRVPCDVIDEADYLVSESSELQAVARLEAGRRLIMILDSERLLPSVREIMTGEEVWRATESEVKERGIDMGEEQLVTFLVGDEEYGIKITQIQEINRLSEVTKLPRSPKFMAGITNLRGQVVPLVDLRIWFGMPLRQVEERTRVIIVDLEHQRTGFIVDQVNEVLRIPLANIEAPPDIMGGNGDAAEQASFITGIGKIDNGRRMILILDIKKLLTRGEQQTLASFREKAAPVGARVAKTAPAAQSEVAAVKTEAEATSAMAKTEAKPKVKKTAKKAGMVIEE